MKEVSVSNQELILFRANANNYLQHAQGRKSPLTWALERMLKRTEQLHQDFLNECDSVRISLAGKDQDGFLIEETTKNGGTKYKFTPENRLLLTEKIETLKLDHVLVEPYIATDVPKDLHVSFVEVFTPFVIEEKESKSEEELMEEYFKPEEA